MITVKARELLADADYVLHDALISPDTLALCGPDVRLERVGKRGGQEGALQDDITARLIELARAGHFVVRLKGGDPFVFGRGGEEALALRGAGVPFEVIPGVTSVVAAPAYAGIPLTHRGLGTSFAVVTASLAGGRSQDLDRMATASPDLISSARYPSNFTS